jgi:hypothetical protein
MSFHTYYQAIPEQSRLFLKLRTERAFSVLYCQLTLLGPGPFRMLNLDAIDKDLARNIHETLDWLAKEEPAFGSRAAADRTMGELQGAIGQAIAEHPGLETRAAYIEQVHDELEKLLVRALKRNGRRAAESLVNTMLYGDAPLAPDLFHPSETTLWLVPASVVHVRAQALAPISSTDLIRDDEDWDTLKGDYDPWRRLYVNAAERGENILVLGS